MSISEKEKQTIARLCLNGSSLDTICRTVKLDQDIVSDVLLSNDVTRKLVLEQAEKEQNGEYTPFFYRSQHGRRRIPDNERRKLRQIRISDAEMERLGNPSTTQMRETLLNMKALEELCAVLDEKGIVIIDDKWLEKEFPKNDAYGLGSLYEEKVYSSTFGKLQSLLRCPSLWDDLR